MKATVALVVDTLALGGAERSLVALAHGLCAYRAGVVTLHAGAALARDLAGVEFIELADERRRYAWMASARRLRRIVRLRRPAVLHSTLFRADQVTRIVGRELGLPVVSSLVSDSYGPARVAQMSPRGRAKLAAVQAVDRATAPLVDVFVANSQSAAEAGMRDVGIPEDRIVVVPRGRDLTRFRPPVEGERTAARALLGLDETARVSATVGRLVPSKNHAFLLDAFARVATPTDIFLVVGDGPEKERLEARAVARGVRSAVRFLGGREDVDVILRAADFFVFGSAFEGAPGSVLEALATGLPSLLVDLPVIREFAGGGSGRFFPPGDLEACAQMWMLLLSLSQLARAEIGVQARRAAEAFSVTTMVARHEAVYENLLARTRRRCG
jgi:glycosyltransferase involved in cell wall biosynthesis